MNFFFCKKAIFFCFILLTRSKGISNSKRELEIERAKKIFECCLFFDQNSSHLFLPIGKVNKFQWRRFHQNSSQNLITKSDDTRIFMEFFKNFDQNTGGNFGGKCIRWLWNSSGISIRILDRNAANPTDDYRIPLKFRLECDKYSR